MLTDQMRARCNLARCFCNTECMQACKQSRSFCAMSLGPKISICVICFAETRACYGPTAMTPEGSLFGT